MKLEEINIGMTVGYIPKHLQNNIQENFEQKNVGTVSSKNDTFVFVKYNGSENSQATRPEDLISFEQNISDSYSSTTNINDFL